jgi:type III secretion protein SpaR/YscT/HrcT
VAGDPAAWVLATALGAARLTPVIWMTPPLGGSRLPAPVRVGFALLLALVAAPALVGGGSAAALARAPMVTLTLLLAREVLVGVCLALVAAAVFRAAEIAGRLADTLRGANMAEVLAPTSDERASPLAALYLLLATLVFLQVGGVPRLIEALLHSYQALPLGGGLPPSPRRVALVVAAASARLIAAGVALSAPVVVAVWLADLALGLVARAAPQVPVYFLGLPLKGLLAVGVVLLGLGTLPAALGGDLGAWLRLLAGTVAAFAG